MTDIPTPGWPADSDAGNAPTNSDPIATTEHLRRLWLAGARDITVTYDEQAVRHRAYLLRPRTGSQ
jgi:hypothetical protein